MNHMVKKKEKGVGGGGGMSQLPLTTCLKEETKIHSVFTCGWLEWRIPEKWFEFCTGERNHCASVGLTIMSVV